MTFRSPLADVVIPDLTLFDYLFGDIESVADQPALIDGPSGAVTTYRALVAQISALAGGLAQRGFGAGDVAAIFCPNIPAFVTVFTAFFGRAEQRPPLIRCTRSRTSPAS